MAKSTKKAVVPETQAAATESKSPVKEPKASTPKPAPAVFELKLTATDPFNGIVELHSNGTTWRVSAHRKGFVSKPYKTEAKAMEVFNAKVGDTQF